MPTTGNVRPAAEQLRTRTERLARLLCEEDGLDPDAEEWVGWDLDTCEQLMRPVWHSRLDEAKRLLRREARKLGIFGSPTFAADGELFWGDDRLEDAISWRQAGRESHAEAAGGGGPSTLD